MSSRLLTFALRRGLAASVLVLIVASAALVLARLAPGDYLSPLEASPEAIAAERKRLCLDCPLHELYVAWLSSVIRFDLGESTRYPGRTVSSLVAERTANSALIGVGALIVTTLVGIPCGVYTGTRRRRLVASAVGALAVLLLSIPAVVLSLTMMLVAARTGWLPVGGLPEGPDALDRARYLVLPVLALALPMTAIVERLQSRSIADALADPSIRAAAARGLSRTRVIWRHALFLSLRPVLAVYGLIIGSLMSGSFIVEYVMTWPGLGTLMYDALVYRDANLVAGCAATGAALLAAGIFVSDVALATVDPRVGEAS